MSGANPHLKYLEFSLPGVPAALFLLFFFYFFLDIFIHFKLSSGKKTFCHVLFFVLPGRKHRKLQATNENLTMISALKWKGQEGFTEENHDFLYLKGFGWFSLFKQR